MAHQSLITIEHHIMMQEREHPEATGVFTGLLMDIALAGKIISREVNKAGLVEILGSTGSVNVQGEEVQKLDEFANSTLIDSLDHTGRVCIMSSEEDSNAIEIPPQYPCGGYTAAFDPLDGSSNIDANVPVGTIFSIHRKISKGPRGDEDDLLQVGRRQVAAGYIIYGSSTMMVYTTGNGVHGFTLDPSVGEFLLSHPNIRTPRRGRTYSANESNYHHWSEGIRRYVDRLKETDKPSGRPYNARYIGSLVADFHRNLLTGGVFLYPADVKDPKKPTGKLRLLYEAAPLAFVAEHAGGYASDGYQPILDLEPMSLHQRVPLFIGSLDDVKEIEQYIAEHDKRS
ncbi:MAG: class 1 fructose-bisphosphatase [Candidatus Zixiibacteriota bacterium]|nr:MAG: class 1 fructose-bisphosphatase [candidate division Zixibacteria bacterium]